MVLFLFICLTPVPNVLVFMKSEETVDWLIEFRWLSYIM